MGRQRADADRSREESSKSHRGKRTWAGRDRDRSSDRRSDRRADRIATLHRSVGNRTVQRLHEAGALQATLTVSQPSDPHEREAERVAEEVTREDPERTTDPDGRGDRAETADRTVDVRRSTTTSGTPTANANGGEQTAGDGLESEVRTLRGGGRPLPESTRSFFESRFGRDFSDVRVHTGAGADRAAQWINAEAFTMGSDVFFASRNYRPNDPDGRELLAHELAHVVQQGEGASRTPAVQRQASVEDELAGRGVEPEGASDEVTSFLSFLTDVETVLGTAIDLGEIAALVSESSLLYAGASAAGPVSIGLFGLLDWMSALQAQQRWAAVQASAYAAVSVVNERDPPGPHDEFGPEGKEAWNAARDKVVAGYRRRLESGGERALETARTLYLLNKREPVNAVNAVYQQLVEEQLQDYFLAVIPVGGTLYKLAKDTLLFWPGPSMRTGVGEGRIEEILSEAEV